MPEHVERDLWVGDLEKVPKTYAHSAGLDAGKMARLP